MYIYIHLCDLNWFHVEWNLRSYMCHHFMIFHDPWLGICGHGHGHGLHTARHFSEGSHPQNHRREPRHALEQMEYDIRQAHHIGIPQKKWWQGETCWSDFLFHVNFERFLAKQTYFWVFFEITGTVGMNSPTKRLGSDGLGDGQSIRSITIPNPCDLGWKDLF